MPEAFLFKSEQVTVLLCWPLRSSGASQCDIASPYLPLGMLADVWYTQVHWNYEKPLVYPVVYILCHVLGAGLSYGVQCPQKCFHKRGDKSSLCSHKHL